MTELLKGEIALVTGASRGIGAAIAAELAAQGATVVGTATSESGANAISERLAAKGGTGRVLDVNAPGAIEALVDAIGKEFGGLSILVNNAGITRDNLLMRMKDEDWQAILDTNLTSVYRTSKAVMRGMMKARKGRIINIASVIGVTGNAGPGELRRGQGRHHRVLQVAGQGDRQPRRHRQRGRARLHRHRHDQADLPEDAKKAMLGEQIALGRLGEPADIAARGGLPGGSDDAAYITGETLHVNGGMYMPCNQLAL